MNCLTEHEQDTFREDFREKEREIQRYIGVYLSGLVLITGWIVGPQTKPLIKMALDNYGYNIYAILILAVLNVLFMCFLIYKSLILHEIMQFVTFHSVRDSGFQYWESWHRSKQSATKRVREVYTTLLSVLPFCVSFFILFGLWKLMHADPQGLAAKLQDIENQSLSQTVTSGGPPPIHTAATSDQLTLVFGSAQLWFWAVAVLHLIPLWFVFENVVPTGRRWKTVNRFHPPRSTYDSLKELPPCNPMDAQAIAEPSLKPLTSRTPVFDSALKRKWRSEIRPSRLERVMAPSFGAISKLSPDASSEDQDWETHLYAFEEFSSKTQLRLLIGTRILILLIALLIPLALVIGSSIVVFGLYVSFDPTSAPRWIEVLPVAFVALMAGWGLYILRKLRRRFYWQRSLLRQIVATTKLSSAEKRVDNE